MADLWRSRVQELIGKSLQQTTSLVDTNRSADSLKALDYYNDVNHQLIDLTTQYAKQYSDEADWSNRPKSIYNMTACVADALATLYHDPVKRNFTDKRMGDAWGNIEGFDSAMQDIDLYTMLCGTVAARPIFINGGLRMGIYTADQIDVTPKADDPSTPDVILLTWKVGGNTIQHVWTDEKFIEAVNDSVDTVQPNPYGQIPIILFTNKRILNSIMDFPAIDLVKANLTLNKLITDLNWTVAFQTHGQLVLKGAPTNFAPKLGPSTYIKMPAEAGSDAYFINPAADIDKAISAINQNLKMFLASRRIPENAIIAQVQNTSGVSIVAQQLSLADYRRRRINRFRPLETQLIRLSLKVLEAHTGGKLLDTKAIEVDLDYKELKAPMDTQEQAEWTFKFQNKIATPVDFIMAENPDLTKDEAEKQYQDNVAFFKKNATVTSLPMRPGGTFMRKPGEPPLDAAAMQKMMADKAAADAAAQAGGGNGGA